MSYRHWLIWVIGPAIGLIVVLSAGAVMALRLWPEPVVERLPLAVLPHAYAWATEAGKPVVALRMAQMGLTGAVCAMLRGDPPRQRHMLTALQESDFRARGTFDPQIIDALRVPGEGPDPALREQTLDLFRGYSLLMHLAADPHRPVTGKVSVLAVQAWSLLNGAWAGYDHHMPSKYKKEMKQTLDHVLAAGDTQGRFGDGLRDQAMAVCTLATLFYLADQKDAVIAPVLTLAQQRLAEIGDAEWSHDPELAALTLMAQAELAVSQRADVDQLARLLRWWTATRTQDTWPETTVTMAPWQRAAWDGYFAAIFRDTTTLASITFETPPASEWRPSLATWWLIVGSMSRDGTTTAAGVPLIDHGLDSTRFAPWRSPYASLGTGDLLARAIALMQANVQYSLKHRTPADMGLHKDTHAAVMQRYADLP